MRRSRPRTWVLRVTENGRDVLRNGRQLQCELTDQAARAYVRRRMNGTDTVKLQEIDGAQRDITRSIAVAR